jgi:hypothetical protein
LGCERPKPQKVPKGRLISIPEVSLVVLDPVLLEQRDEFLLEGHSFVVLRLIPDVNEGEREEGCRVI